MKCCVDSRSLGHQEAFANAYRFLREGPRPRSRDAARGCSQARSWELRLPLRNGAWRIEARSDGVAIRFTFNVDSQSSLANVPGSIAMSPDGRQIAIAANGPDGRRRFSFVRSAS
jgi:hypothetical protein